MSSLNKIILVGRLASDPDIKATTSGDSLSKFTLIVERPQREDGAAAGVDYINCVAWRDLADKMSSVMQDNMVLVEGRILTRSYETDEGQRKYTTEVEVREWRALGGETATAEGAAFSLEPKSNKTVSEEDFDFSDASPSGPLDQEPDFGSKDMEEEDIPF